MISVVIFHWRRPANVHRICEALKHQEGVAEVIVWNNSGQPEQFDCDWQLSSSRNVYAHPLPWLWQQSDQPYVGKMDDDLVPNHCRAFVQAIDALERRYKPTHHRLVGGFGAILRPGQSYAASEMVNNDVPHDRAVDVCKGRIMICRREAADELPARISHRHVDLAVSFALARGRRHAHLVAGCLHGKLVELPDGNHGHSTNPVLASTHWQQRTKLSHQWLKQIASRAGQSA